MSNENTATPYDELDYNELRKVAAERGLPSQGTKEELKARLVEADGGAGSGDSNGSDANAGDQTPPPPPPARPSAPSSRTAPAARNSTDEKFLTKTQRTKAHLDKQPKVMVFIPFEAGENPEQAAKVPFHVGINGYHFDIPRGTAVEVPKQVAEMVAERLESEGKAGRGARVDLDAKKQEALS